MEIRIRLTRVLAIVSATLVTTSLLLFSLPVDTAALWSPLDPADIRGGACYKDPDEWDGTCPDSPSGYGSCTKTACVGSGSSAECKDLVGDRDSSFENWYDDTVDVETGGSDTESMGKFYCYYSDVCSGCEQGSSGLMCDKSYSTGNEGHNHYHATGDSC